MTALLWVALAGAQTPDRHAWIADLVAGHELTEEQAAAVRAIAERSDRLGQGLPGPTTHPMTPEVCQQRRAAAGLQSTPPDSACGRPYMVPIGTVGERQTCIDQYEFPGLPCQYPIVWARASEAAAICGAMGKRLCDAHEWEGACAGELRAPDYPFDAIAGMGVGNAHKTQRTAHNAAESADRSWTSGTAPPGKGVCAQASTKSDACGGSDPKRCGSNTYPTGAFPDCVSPLGAYDLHGNAAEHMNLPLAPDQLASAGGLGVTEMKGSWFIWERYAAHEDWCRWRAPFWHGGPVAADDSHRNYHLGFRCCADVMGSP